MVYYTVHTITYCIIPHINKTQMNILRTTAPCSGADDWPQLVQWESSQCPEGRRATRPDTAARLWAPYHCSWDSNQLPHSSGVKKMKHWLHIMLWYWINFTMTQMAANHAWLLICFTTLQCVLLTGFEFLLPKLNLFLYLSWNKCDKQHILQTVGNNS